MAKLALMVFAVLQVGVGLNGHAQGTPLDRLKAYIEIDTTNPPGNEARGVEFFSRIFDEAGIVYETVESAPGRGNIWARLKGGSEPSLVLLHHMDVVPATASEWNSDPLTAVEKDGVLFGRGTLDTKFLGILHLEAFLALHRSGRLLNRDVIFMATADEEAGGLLGAGWLIENRPEIFENVGYLLTEGGSGVQSGGETWFEIELAQKRPYWLRLTATDKPGHGSTPRSTSAPSRLIQALSKIYETPFEPRIVDSVRQMFEAMSALAEPAWQESFQNIDEAILDPEFVRRFQAEKPDYHALIRNTCSITILTASNKINVVPPIASAELDCRILPDQNAEEFLDDMRARINDDQISIDEIMRVGATQSSADTDLFRLLHSVSLKYYPSTSVVRAVGVGFTDSHFFRDIGITSYGYAPVIVPEADFSGVHGNDERIGINTFNRGIQMMTEIVSEFATSAGN